LKRILFLVISTLLVLGLVLPGCGGPGGGPGARPTIVIGIPYPAGTPQGDSMCKGAELAVSQINVHGVNVTVAGNTTLYNFKLIELNDNEIADPTNAWNTVDHLVSVNHVNFVIGGFRSEAVEPMIQNVFRPLGNTSTPFFIDGAATAQLLSGGFGAGGPGGSPPSSYPNGYGTPYAYGANDTSNAYKYIFRVTPFNSNFLLGMVMAVFAQVTQDIQTAMNWTYNLTTHAWNHKVNVAIVGENLTWAQPIIGGYQALVGGALGGAFGWNLTVTKTFSDSADSGIVGAALQAVQDAENQVILTCMSGPVGETFGKQMAATAKNVTAIPVGINVEAQDPNYGINTQSQYEVTTGTWAQGVNNTPLTYQFLQDYKSSFGSMPTSYTASSYDMVYSLKEAIEFQDSYNKDAVCSYLETHARNNTSGYAAYYPVWDGNTHQGKYGVQYPALNTSQVAAIYTANGYNAAYNFTMAPFTTNDLIYGVGYLTGICVQWQKIGSTYTQVGMWPNAGYNNVLAGDYIAYGKVQTTLMRTLCGLNWSNSLEYPGTSNAVIPAAYQTVWHTWFP
jgi:branched-chain amino acid transport system substrate-binding protein